VASPSFLLIAAAGFAVAAVASICMQFGRYTRATSCALAVGILLGILSVGSQLLLQTTAHEQEEPFIVTLLANR
jgi:hypothetical protein